MASAIQVPPLLTNQWTLLMRAGLVPRGNRWLVVARTWRLGCLLRAPLIGGALLSGCSNCAELADAKLGGLDAEICSRVGDTAAELLKMAEQRQANSGSRHMRQIQADSGPAHMGGRASCSVAVQH